MLKPHILIVSFPRQGHINPALQFANRLASYNLTVTFATTSSATNILSTTPSMTFASFSDGHDTDTTTTKPPFNLVNYIDQVKSNGPQSLKQLIEKQHEAGTPFTCVVYSLFLPWVAYVARDFHIPSVFLWNQAAAVFSIYYHYFNGYRDGIEKIVNGDESSMCVKLPGLVELSGIDLPSYFAPGNPYGSMLSVFKEHLEAIELGEMGGKVFVNTFDALEGETMKWISKFKLIGVGPLIPPAILDGKNPLETSYGGDLVQGSGDAYMDWLDTKFDASVIYIAFGSHCELLAPQMEELENALILTGRPFLWVIRDEQKLMRAAELKRLGKVVNWCSQVEVLSHRSVGCFVTHCGWNSTTESLACGVPVVAFPQFTDQLTDAKMVQDIWRTGVRVRAKRDGIVESKEIKRCLELVTGDGDAAIEMRLNALKYKSFARAAAREGGSSDKNIKEFANAVAGGHFSRPSQ